MLLSKVIFLNSTTLRNSVSLGITFFYRIEACSPPKKSNTRHLLGNQMRGRKRDTNLLFSNFGPSLSFSFLLSQSHSLSLSLSLSHSLSISLYLSHTISNSLSPHYLSFTLFVATLYLQGHIFLFNKLV